MSAWTARDAAELLDLAERIDELRARRDAQPTPGAGSRTWNVIAPVIAVLGAPSSVEALSRLTRALRAARFDVYDDPAAAASFPPFEAEDGTEEADPPPNGWPL